MKKSNFFFKNLNNINRSINILLEKNLNKLNFENLRNLLVNNKIILTFVALFVILISYLLLPTFYNQSDLSKGLKRELMNKLNLNFSFSNNLNYNFFPRPHFVTTQASIFVKDKEISKIKKIKIFISIKNLISLKKIELKDVILENANFNINKQNYNFFSKLLDNNFIFGDLKIKNSNIFFRDKNQEVLFIDKIIDMKYFFDNNELKNIIIANNEIFNIPHEIEIFKDKKQKKLYSKLKLNYFKLQIESELNYNDNLLKGKSDFIHNKIKSTALYEFNKIFFKYKIFDKLDNREFFYRGKLNFKPFYSTIEGEVEKINLKHLFGQNALISQLLKTELLNNRNIDFKLNILANYVLNNSVFKNINITSKIQEGLIDMDETKFQWKDFAEFKLSDSLIYVKDGELVLDGKIKIDIKKFKEIYKFLLTPKNYRNKIKQIDFNFTYNFDQKIAKLNDVKIDGNINQNLDKILNSVILKESVIQNKIYIKNLLNDAIKSYAG